MSLRHFSERIGTATEVLVIRGVLGDDLQFTPLFCGSEFRRPKLANSFGSEIDLALLDRDGRVLITERAGIRNIIDCSRRAPRAHVIEGSIPLLTGAQRLAIRKRKVQVAELTIGERPKLEVRWSEQTVTREGKYVLGLDYSEPTEDAMVKVFLQWGPEQYLLAFAGKPRSNTEVSFENMPGGRKCQLIAVYSSGLRTSVARSMTFELAPLTANVDIVRPLAGQVFAPWHPVELQGQVRDRQRGDVPGDECVWTLKGKEIGRGLLIYGGFLEPGSYEAQLQYRKTQQSVRFRVAKGAQA